MTLPKYAQVQSGIVNLIATENIQMGGLLPSERELSDRFSVSILTVRRAVGNLEQKQIVRREQGKGTFVIAGIQENVDQGAIALLNISRKEMVLPVFGRQEDSLASHLTRRGYRLTSILAGAVPDTDAIKPLQNVKGVIATGWITGRWVQWLTALDVPVVFYGAVRGKSIGIPQVCHDWQAMAEMLTEALLQRGATKIGLLLGGRDYAPTEKMIEGHKSILKKHNLVLEPSHAIYLDTNPPDSMALYLAAHPELDGFLVDAGVYVHLLANLLNLTRRPQIGVLSAAPWLGHVCEQTIEAAFKGNLYEKTAALLLEMIESRSAHTRDILLKPYLVSAREAQTQNEVTKTANSAICGKESE